jgi:hypothetical protein
MINCRLKERSINKESMATIHAPTAKKNSMRPGTKNSSRKNTNPIINQMTAACKKISIIY